MVQSKAQADKCVGVDAIASTYLIYISATASYFMCQPRDIALLAIYFLAYSLSNAYWCEISFAFHARKVTNILNNVQSTMQAFPLILQNQRL